MAGEERKAETCLPAGRGQSRGGFMVDGSWFMAGEERKAREEFMVYSSWFMVHCQTTKLQTCKSP